VILDGNKTKIGRAKKAPKCQEPTEQKEIFNFSLKKK
jgi:hypothetical protein